MNNNYSSYNSMPDNGQAAEKKPVKKLEKGIKRLLIIAAVIFAAQLIWLFGITPFVPFSVIEVQEIEGLNRAHILYISGIDENSSYFSTNAASAHKILSGHILVESAIVTKRFPDKLSIFITPRVAAAVTLANINSKQVPVYIDRQGVFFKTGEDVQGRDAYSVLAKFPIISGIENPQLNTRLPGALVPLVENLYQMSFSSPELLSAISEIRIERKTWDGFDLVLFPVHNSIKVRVENSLTEDKLRYTLLMLNIIDLDSYKPKEIDFRSGMVSYSVKELL